MDQERIARFRRSALVAWRVAAAACLCAVACAVALALLLPLKSIEPFLVRVDRSSGLVDVVPVYAGNSTMDEAVTRYLLTHYVTVCERFNFPMAESDYEECGAFNSNARNQAWSALWNRNNPASPLNLYKDGSSVHAAVVSVSFFKRGNGAADLAQVRYVKTRRLAAGTELDTGHWIATVQYSYSRPSQDPRIRQWNPLGFRIQYFSAEAEMPAGIGGENPAVARNEGTP